MKKNCKIISTLGFTLSLVIGFGLIAFAAPITVNLNLGTEPPTIDPALATDLVSEDVIEQLFLGLTDYDDKTMAIIKAVSIKAAAVISRIIVRDPFFLYIVQVYTLRECQVIE